MTQEWSNWDVDFLELAKWWANRKSKDPRTKVGAVVVGPNRVPLGMGYNGFPRGVKDLPERYADRDTKLELVVHAEVNAVLTASQAGPLPPGSTLYCTLMCCNECAKVIIQAGIKRVVVPFPMEDRPFFGSARLLFKEAGVDLIYYGKA